MEKLIYEGIGLKELLTSRISFLTEKKQKKMLSNISQVEKYIEKYKNHLITYLDEVYPDILRNSYSPPTVIFFEGRKKLLLEEPAISIVGSRKATAYGINVAQKLAKELDEKGLVIVSGLAAGIDAAAHKGSLDSGGRTIAVLGTGIDVIYPSSNRELFLRIANNGCIVSEFLPGTPPLKQNFPRRNRIIAGLSQAVLVVEAAIKSGSLITAKLALENGRDVFAVPGDITRKNSEGTNWLIKNGAKLITRIEDVLEEFPNFSTTIFKEEYPDSAVLNSLETGPMDFNQLLLATGIEYGQLVEELLDLQLKGFITEDQGVWQLSP
ncbi:DNA-processing protein DprA [Kosmotoga pacifica]|nr:DNA-processing protein DprA [Kosmotoga pacifica]